MKKLLFSQILFACLLVMAGCGGGDDETPAPIADFTFEVDGFTVDFTNTSKNDKSVSWDFGDDSDPETTENPSHTYEEPGDYDVTLTVTGTDNSTKTTTKTVTIEEPVNVVVSGDMSDATKWTYIGITGGQSTTSYSFDGGVLTFTGEGQLNGAVYQAISLQPGTYQVRANITTDNSVEQTWVEFYLPEAEPTGSDITTGKIVGWSTWDACKGVGMDAEITGELIAGNTCVSGMTAGKIEIASAGTYYLVIKAGAWDGTLGTGLKVDDVKLLKLN